MTKRVADLRAGDRFDYGYDAYGHTANVLVKGRAEPWTDRFGRPMLMLHAQRMDTLQKGIMYFGPDASLDLSDCGDGDPK